MKPLTTQECQDLFEIGKISHVWDRFEMVGRVLPKHSNGSSKLGLSCPRTGKTYYFWGHNTLVNRIHGACEGCGMPILYKDRACDQSLRY